MIEIEFEDRDKIINLYNEIKDIIISKKDNENFKYIHEQHHLYEEEKYPGISKNYYNESGSVQFVNNEGKTIRLEIYRWHPHKHNSFNGLNGNPCLNAAIYLIKDDEEININEVDNDDKKELIWELCVTSGTLYYKAEVSDLEIPIDLLQEKQLTSNAYVKKHNSKMFKNNRN